MAGTTSRYATVPIRSRVNYRVTFQFDGEPFEWGPHETVHLPFEAARHCLMHSRVKWDPFTQRDVLILHEVEPGKEYPPDLTWEDTHPTELLDRRGMPPTAFDDDGNPLPQTMKVLKLGEPVGMMRGRVPVGGNIGPDGRAFGGDHGLGASAPLDPEMRARLDAAHDAFAEGAAQIQETAEREAAGGSAP